MHSSPPWYAYKAFADITSLHASVRQREEEHDAKLSVLYSQIYRVQHELVQEKERHAAFQAEGIARAQSLARMEDELVKTADALDAADRSFRARLSHLEDSRLSASIELDASLRALADTRAQVSSQKVEYDEISATAATLQAEKDDLKQSLREARAEADTERHYAEDLLAELLLEKERSRVLEEKLAEAEGLLADSKR